jgi:hypothetical protein
MSNRPASPREGHYRLGSTLARLARSGYFPVYVAALAVLLALPALKAGWIMDDYYHRAVMLPDSPFRTLLGPPAEMFRFFRGDPVRTGRIMDLGVFPWWTDPTLKAEFLQALTVFTHRLDYAIWPDSPVLMHAHSLVWLCMAVAAVAVFYREVLGPTWVTAVAAILYAIDDARGPVVGFIANRNVLVAATFGAWSLICHARRRRGGSVAYAILAPALLTCALFSKEEGIGTCAYLFAYGLLADRAGSVAGCLALAPYLLVVLAWRIVRDYWGYGVHDVGLYIDPIADPWPFLAALVERSPHLLLGQWSAIPSETAVVIPARYLTAFWWFAIGFVVMVAVAMVPLLRRNRLARFWAAGMMLALLPVSATLAMDRLLTFPAIGAFGLLAQYFAFSFGEPRGGFAPGWKQTGIMAVAWVFFLTHVVWAPIVLPFRSANPVGAKWIDERCYIQASFGPVIGGKTLVVVNAPSPAHAGYVAFQQALRGEPMPAHIRVLAPAVPAVTIRRLDAQTLEITPDSGYLGWVLDRIFRGERRPLAVGEEVKLTGMTARVTAVTADGRPAVATFRFSVALESETLVWLCFRHHGFERFSPPAIGQEAVIRFDWRAMLTP